MKTIVELLGAIEGLFAHVHLTSILLGLGVALGLTYLLKVPIGWRMIRPNPTDEELARFRWTIRMMGFVIGFVVTWATWPGPYGWAWGVVVGSLVSPVYHLYGPVQRRFFPWLSVTAKEEADAGA